MLFVSKKKRLLEYVLQENIVSYYVVYLSHLIMSLAVYLLFVKLTNNFWLKCLAVKDIKMLQ